MKPYENQNNLIIGGFFSKEMVDLATADLMWKAKELEVIINSNLFILPTPISNQYPNVLPAIHLEPNNDVVKETSNTYRLMLISENILAKEWDTAEEDKAWEHLEKGI